MQKTELKTSQLGSTGLDITRVGFSAWAIGGGWESGWGRRRTTSRSRRSTGRLNSGSTGATPPLPAVSGVRSALSAVRCRASASS